MTIESLANRLDETPLRELPSFAKDRGVDVIGWIRFEDGRPGQTVLLVQSASGHNWKNKLKDISLRAWGSYIDWACAPLKGFIMPAIVSDEERFFENSLDAGILFDRGRIYKLLCKGRMPAVLKGALDTWCSDSVTALACFVA